MAKDFQAQGFDIALPPTVEESPEWNLDYLETLQTELENQLFHLKRSQQELKEELKLKPDDEDFKEAYEENKIVIAKTSARLKETAELIARIKYVDDSGYWTSDSFSVLHKRPAEYSAETAGNMTRDVTLPSTLKEYYRASEVPSNHQQKANEDTSETKDQKDEHKDGDENKTDEDESIQL